MNNYKMLSKLIEAVAYLLFVVLLPTFRLLVVYLSLIFLSVSPLTKPATKSRPSGERARDSGDNV